MHDFLTGQMTGYLYDAEGNRVAKGTITSWSCDTTLNANGQPNNGLAVTASYILDPSGQQLTEMTWSGNQALFGYTNVQAAGQLIASYTPGTGNQVVLNFQLRDWLGTLRAQTDGAGTVQERCESLPYGNGQTCVNLDYLFTGKERDAESGNDYFGARYYGSNMGRFLSPDWSAKEEPVPYAKLDDPQTLNLYSYVLNNPLARADADGHCGEDGCAIEGGVTLYLLGAAAVAGTAAVLRTPEGQRSWNTFASAASENFSSNVQAVKNKLSNIFNSDKKPGTKGKPDHQQTAKEEAEKIGGEPEVRIPTPGGTKETRVGDAVATDADHKVTAVTQVIRPTPAGNVPLREKKAAQDIENATGVKPKLVPVRPLPQQQQ